MDRLQRELQRLHVSQADAGLSLDRGPIDAPGRVRAMVFELAKPVDIGPH